MVGYSHTPGRCIAHANLRRVPCVPKIKIDLLPKNVAQVGGGHVMPGALCVPR